MKFYRVILNSVSNCCQVCIDLVISFIFIFIISVSNFCYMNLILLVSLWSWSLYLITTTKNLTICSLLCDSSFNTSISLQMEGWNTITSFEISFDSLPLHCSSCGCHSGLMYKHFDFLMKISALLVFSLCHIFHEHTFWKHNLLGHRNIFLHFPQCTQNFPLLLPKTQMEAQILFIIFLQTSGYYYNC